MYDTNLKRKWDNDLAREKAWIDGKEAGKKKEAIEISKEMKKGGMPIAQVSKFTKLTTEETENL